MDDDREQVIGNLVRLFEQGRPLLFTGAGFSLGAYDASKRPLPDSSQLTKELWSLAQPDVDYDGKSSLQDVFYLAVRTARTATTALMAQRLRVDPSSLPPHFELFFQLPWRRIYTLNIDTLASAAAATFKLPHLLREYSATSQPDLSRERIHAVPTCLEVVHLNGMLQDVPDSVTFSIPQYAQRSVGADALYQSLVSELATHPVVYVGTSLDEPPLWQHIALRDLKGGRDLSELRPKLWGARKPFRFGGGRRPRLPTAACRMS